MLPVLNSQKQTQLKIIPNTINIIEPFKLLCTVMSLSLGNGFGLPLTSSFKNLNVGDPEQLAGDALGSWVSMDRIVWNLVVFLLICIKNELL